MKRTDYMQQGMDLKRLVLVLCKKLWLILAGALLGALAGALLYIGIARITDGKPEYRASADYYITFIAQGADYYNAYTWDSILRDDPIVDHALLLLPDEITKEMVKDAVSGEMLGDYRILTVHVKAEEKETADLIAEAYEKALWNFGQEMELLDKVELWSSEEAVLYEKHTKTANAAFLGALLTALAVLFGELFYYCLLDACYTERDAKERFGLLVFGIQTKGKDSLQEQMLKENLEYRLKGSDPEIWNGEQIPDKKACEGLRKAESLLVSIPWGRNNGRQVERVLNHLALQGCEVKGLILTEADDRFLKTYYAVERRKKRKEL